MDASVAEFRAIRKRLKAAIEKTLEFDEEPEKCFSPGSDVDDVLRNREEDVAKLLSHGLRACEIRPDRKELVEIVRVVTGKQNEKYACTRVMAILICISVERDSETWMNFTKICRAAARASIKGRPFDGLEIHQLRDSELPFNHEHIKSYLSNTHDSLFYDWQYKFCAIIIRTDKEQSFDTQATKHQHLPYLSQSPIGKGSFGIVWRTEIAKGHWATADSSSNTSKVLARKDLYFEKDAVRGHDSSAAEHEWDIAKHLQEQSFKHENVLPTLAMLRFEDHISIFLDLATCDLTEVLRGRKATKKRQTSSGNIKTDPGSAITNIPSEYEKQPWRPPLTYASKIALLLKMLSVAEALWHLHKLRDPDDQFDMACIHKDLKPGNILVFGQKESYRDTQFRIADFSISSLKKKERPVDVTAFFRRTNKDADNSSSGAQNVPTSAWGNDANECLAPEAWGEHSTVTTKADVWSFGCVLCLFITWLFDGPEGLRRFDKTRFSAGRRENFFLRQSKRDLKVDPLNESYLVRDNDVFSLKQEVEQWFNGLVSRLEENGDKQEAVMCKNFWHVLQDRMLQVRKNKREYMGKALKLLRDVVHGREILGSDSVRSPSTAASASERLSSSTPRTSHSDFLPLSSSRPSYGPPHPNSRPQPPPTANREFNVTFWAFENKGAQKPRSHSLADKGKVKPRFSAKNGMSSPEGDCLIFQRDEEVAFARSENCHSHSNSGELGVHRSTLKISNKYCLGSDYICGVGLKGSNEVVFSPFTESAGGPKGGRSIYDAKKIHLCLPNHIESSKVRLLAMSSASLDKAHVACAAQTLDRDRKETIQVFVTGLADFSSLNEPRRFQRQFTSQNNPIAASENWIRMKFKPEEALRNFKDTSKLYFSLGDKYLILSTQDAIYTWDLTERTDGCLFKIKDHRMNDEIDDAVTATIPFHTKNSILGIVHKRSIFTLHYDHCTSRWSRYETNIREIGWVCLAPDDKRIYVVAKLKDRFGVYSCDFEPNSNSSSQTQMLEFHEIAVSEQLSPANPLICATLSPPSVKGPRILLANVLGYVETHWLKTRR